MSWRHFHAEECPSRTLSIRKVFFFFFCCTRTSFASTWLVLIASTYLLCARPLNDCREWSQRGCEDKGTRNDGRDSWRGRWEGRKMSEKREKWKGWRKRREMVSRGADERGGQERWRREWRKKGAALKVASSSTVKEEEKIALSRRGSSAPFPLPCRISGVVEGTRA